MSKILAPCTSCVGTNNVIRAGEQKDGFAIDTQTYKIEDTVNKDGLAFLSQLLIVSGHKKFRCKNPYFRSREQANNPTREQWNDKERKSMTKDQAKHRVPP